MMVMLIVFLMGGCSLGGSDDPKIDTSTAQAKIDNSTLQYPAKNEDFRYNVYTYYVTISQCLSNKSNIVIPDTINDLPVLIIEHNAFEGKVGMMSLTMTNNIVEIQDYAFKGCTNLQEISISNSLATLGTGTFEDCENLLAVRFPAQLTDISSGTFRNCHRLNAVTIEENPDAVVPEGSKSKYARNIRSSAFKGCESLVSIWVPKEMGIEEGAFDIKETKVTIFGEAETPSATYAATNRLDYVVLSNVDFREILNNASAKSIVSIGDSIESNIYKISLDKVYTASGTISYDSGTRTNQTYNIDNDSVVIFCFSVKNMTSSKQTFSIFDIKGYVNDYSSRISTFGKITNIDLGKYNQPLFKELESGETLYGYVALRADANWNKVAIQFCNDMSLEANQYAITSDNKTITMFSNKPEEKEKVTEQSEESKTEQAEKEDVTQTESKTEKETTTVKTTEESTTAAVVKAN